VAGAADGGRPKVEGPGKGSQGRTTLSNGGWQSTSGGGWWAAHECEAVPRGPNAKWRRSPNAKREMKSCGFQSHLYSSVRQVIPVSPGPLIFIGEATPPMDICHVHLSVT
jgi:hypothetical protein